MGFTEDDIPIGAISRYRGCVMRAINGEPALEEEFVGVVDLFWSGSATVAGVAALEMALFYPNESPSLLLRPGKLFLQAKVDWLEWGMLRRPWLSRHIVAGLSRKCPAQLRDLCRPGSRITNMQTRPRATTAEQEAWIQHSWLGEPTLRESYDQWRADRVLAHVTSGPPSCGNTRCVDRLVEID